MVNITGDRWKGHGKIMGHDMVEHHGSQMEGHGKHHGSQMEGAW